jgi:hypothetical protein
VGLVIENFGYEFASRLTGSGESSPNVGRAGPITPLNAVRESHVDVLGLGVVGLVRYAF